MIQMCVRLCTIEAGLWWVWGWELIPLEMSFPFAHPRSAEMSTHYTLAYAHAHTAVNINLMCVRRRRSRRHTVRR